MKHRSMAAGQSIDELDICTFVSMCILTLFGRLGPLGVLSLFSWGVIVQESTLVSTSHSLVIYKPNGR